MKNLFKKIMSVSLASMMLFAVGCGSSSSSSSSAENSGAVNSGEDTSLQQVMDAGKLVLGLDPTFKPMGYTDENDQIVGFDIDVAQEVCSRMGIELETYSVNWDTKEQDLNAGTIDCIWNGLSVSEKRKEEMLLSDPYMKNDMIFLVNNDSGISSQADLEGKVVAVQNGSTAQEILNSSELVTSGSVVVMELATNVEAIQQLELQLADAVFLDLVVAEYEITSTGKDMTVLPDGLQSEEYAIGFRKGDEALCNKIEETLKEMVADGTMAEISTKWFGKDVCTIE
ncbi:MAG: amino acid ABC transporter substrate-binding protein [Hominimerdicola sp.]